MSNKRYAAVLLVALLLWIVAIVIWRMYFSSGL